MTTTERDALEWTAFAERARQGSLGAIGIELCDGVLKLAQDVARLERMVKEARAANAVRRPSIAERVAETPPLYPEQPAGVTTVVVETSPADDAEARRKKKADYMRRFRKGERVRATKEGGE